MLPGHPRVLLKMVHPRRYLDKGYMKRVAPELYGGDLRATTRTRRALHRPCARRTSEGLLLPAPAMLWTSLPWLWRIHHPTLVLAGSDDPLVLLVNARLHAAAARPAARVRRRPPVPADARGGDGAGHRRFLAGPAPGTPLTCGVDPAQTRAGIGPSPV